MKLIKILSVQFCLIITISNPFKAIEGWVSGD